MAVASSPYFLLKTAGCTLEVARFFLYNWGISREYEIDLTLQNCPQDCVLLNKSAVLEFDDHCFHGFILLKNESCSGKNQEINIRLVSPLTYALKHNQSCFYPPTPLKQVLALLLSEAGLRLGFDFKLQLRSGEKIITIHQNNVTKLCLLHDLMRKHALYYAYEQLGDRATCIITDDLSLLLPTGVKTLPFVHHRGFNTPSGVHHMDSVTKLCSSLLVNRVYQPDKTDCLNRTALSCHPFSVGQRAISFLATEESLRGVRASMDENAHRVVIKLPYQDFLPGQTIRFIEDSQPTMNISSIDLTGVQEPLVGSGSTECTSVGHERIQAKMFMSNSWCGLPKLSMPLTKPRVQFNVACIAHRKSAAPDVSSKGEYQIRFAPKCVGAQSMFPLNSSPHANMWVRNALYYSGHHYGFSYPFSDGSDVVIAYENGHAERPVIIGVLPNPLAPSVVTEKNSSNNILSMAEGTTFMMQNTSSGCSLEIASVEKRNKIIVSHGLERKQLSILSLEGKMTFKAHEHIEFTTSDKVICHAKASQRYWASKTLKFSCYEKEVSILSEETIRIHGQALLNINSEKQILRAQDYVCLQATGRLNLDARLGMSLISAQGKHCWRSHHGSVQLFATKQLVIKCHETRLVLTPVSITLITDKALHLNAPCILGLD